MTSSADLHGPPPQMGPLRRTNRPTFFLCAFCFLLTLVPCAQSTEPTPPDAALFGKAIRRIVFDSDLPLVRAQYEPFLGIRPGDPLTRTAVKNAIQFLYESGRFSSIAVDALPDEDAAILRFRLRHNYYFNRFSVNGDFDLKGRSLWEAATLPIGQRFTAERLNEVRLAVVKLMNDRGFYLATARARTVIDEKARQIDTIFDVKAGKLAVVRSVEIVGAPSTEAGMIRGKLKYREGDAYDRSRLNSRIDGLRKHLVSRGYLAASVGLAESFEPESNTVALSLRVDNLGRMRVAVEGFRIDQDQLRRLLPILAGEGVDPAVLEEGIANLKEYLETKGHPDAEIRVDQTVEDPGIRVFHYIITPNRRYTVSHIRFKGNKAITDREMVSLIEIRPETVFQSTPFSNARLESDVSSLKSMYASRGYLQAEIIPEIEFVGSGSKLGITYVCKEGDQARLRSLNIEGNQSLSTKELLSRVRLTPGGAYSPSLAEQDRQAVLSAYNDLGYLRPQVSVHAGAPDENNGYALTFQIDEGPRSLVGRVLVLGGDTTRASVIRKKIMLRENEPLSLSRMLETQQSLYSTGVFDQVRVAQQNPESVAPFQDVVVRLQESKRFTVRYGVGYHEREKVRGTVEFTHLNVLGLGRRADLRLRGSGIEQQASLSFQQPQLRAIPIDSYLTFSALQRQEVSFDTRRFSLSYQYSHPFGKHVWGMARYNFKNVRISKAQVQLSELGREDQPVNLSTFSVAMVADTRDDFLDPGKGFFSSTDIGITPRMWGDHQYFSFFTQNSYYRTLPWTLMLAGSARFGAAHPFGGVPELPISERFFAGGGSSLRGFDNDYAGPLDLVSNKPVGGNALLVGSLELRVPFFRFIHVAGFYDSGNVFRSVSDVSLSEFSHTLGGGLRIKTPFGPLRADYGWNLNLSADLRQRGLKRGHFFITVGSPF